VNRFLALLFVILALVRPVDAHELRPAYLELNERAPGQFTVLWKVPAAGDRRLGLNVDLPQNCHNITEPTSSFENAVYLERWQVSCDDGLKGRTITIDGLRSTLTDVIARITWVDSTVEIERLTPEQPTLILKGSQTTIEVVRTYFLLGTAVED
jgi:hypothetical protein